MNVKHSNCFFVIRLFAALCVLIGHATRDLNISVFGYTPESKAIYCFTLWSITKDRNV